LRRTPPKNGDTPRNFGAPTPKNVIHFGGGGGGGEFTGGLLGRGSHRLEKKKKTPTPRAFRNFSPGKPPRGARPGGWGVHPAAGKAGVCGRPGPLPASAAGRVHLSRGGPGPGGNPAIRPDQLGGAGRLGLRKVLRFGPPFAARGAGGGGRGDGRARAQIFVHGGCFPQRFPDGGGLSRARPCCMVGHREKQPPFAGRLAQGSELHRRKPGGNTQTQHMLTLQLDFPAKNLKGGREGRAATITRGGGRSPPAVFRAGSTGGARNVLGFPRSPRAQDFGGACPPAAKNRWAGWPGRLAPNPRFSAGHGRGTRIDFWGPVAQNALRGKLGITTCPFRAREPGTLGPTQTYVDAKEAGGGVFFGKNLLYLSGAKGDPLYGHEGAKIFWVGGPTKIASRAHASRLGTDHCRIEGDPVTPRQGSTGSVLAFAANAQKPPFGSGGTLDRVQPTSFQGGFGAHGQNAAPELTRGGPIFPGKVIQRLFRTCFGSG